MVWPKKITTPGPLLLLLLVGCAPLCAHAQSQPDDLQRQLVQAQIDYYKAQAAPKTFRQLFFDSLPSLIGTSVGALLALSGVYLSSKKQWNLEEKKWRESRKDELDRWNRSQKEAADRRQQNREDEILRETRLAVAELTRKIAAGGQSLEALTWWARHEPNTFTVKHVEEHDSRMATIYTEMLGAQLVVATLAPSLYERTRPIVKEVYRLDAEVARWSKDLMSDPKQVTHLGYLWPEVVTFNKAIPKQIEGILGMRNEAAEAE
jgi:hypothetical protein